MWKFRGHLPNSGPLVTGLAVIQVRMSLRPVTTRLCPFPQKPINKSSSKDNARPTCQEWKLRCLGERSQV